MQHSSPWVCELLHAMEQHSFVPRSRLQSNFYTHSTLNLPHYSHKLVLLVHGLKCVNFSNT